MHVPISVAVMLIVVIAVVGLFYLNYADVYPGSEQNIQPVRASLPAGNSVYKISNTYVIPIHFSKSTDKPIGVCRMDISYLDQYNNIKSATVVFALSPRNYRTSANFSDGSAELQIPIIERSLDTTLTVRFNNDGYRLNAITLYYCEYGISTNPKWSESLMIPETVLSP